MKTLKSLIDMRTGQIGRVSAVLAGRGLCSRLDAMQIIPGTMLRKISGSFLRGPVTVQVGNARVALGFGMAAKVMLEIDD